MLMILGKLLSSSLAASTNGKLALPWVFASFETDSFSTSTALASSLVQSSGLSCGGNFAGSILSSANQGTTCFFAPQNAPTSARHHLDAMEFLVATKRQMPQASIPFRSCSSRPRPGSILLGSQ